MTDPRDHLSDDAEGAGPWSADDLANAHAEIDAAIEEIGAEVQAWQRAFSVVGHVGREHELPGEDLEMHALAVSCRAAGFDFEPARLCVQGMLWRAIECDAVMVPAVVRSADVDEEDQWVEFTAGLMLASMAAAMHYAIGREGAVG